MVNEVKQHQLKSGPLLDDKGNLVEAGYATSLIKKYQRKMVKVKGMRIKEWDYYFIGNETYGIAVTVADNSYMWLTSVTFFDFEKKSENTKSLMGWFPNGKLHMPESSEKSDVIFKNKKMNITFKLKDKQRLIHVDVKEFEKGKDLTADLVLEPTMKPSMVIATPFEKKRHFYYNQKINLLKTRGEVFVGEKRYDFNDAYGVLDWGRGVWTYKNTWYWSSLSGIEDGHAIGFNLGYGFGDTSKASENMIFYDGESYKLEDVIFDIPQKHQKDDFMSTWKIYSQSKDIDLTFNPILDRHSHSNVILISSNQHQVFGYFSGKIKIKDGHIIEIKKMLGFAEKVENRW